MLRSPPSRVPSVPPHGRPARPGRGRAARAAGALRLPRDPALPEPRAGRRALHARLPRRLGARRRTAIAATAFHWTEDGAWLRFPVVAHGPVRARLRHARFTKTPAAVTVVGEGRTVATWEQHARGFRLRKLDLGTWERSGRAAVPHGGRGAAARASRSTGSSSRTCAARVRPAPSLARLLALLVGVPLAIGLLTRSAAAGAAFGVGLSALGVGAVWVDRLGGLLALAAAAVPALLVTVALGALARGRRSGASRTCSTAARCWSRGRGTLVALVALSQPFFYYPDVDTHADLVDALDEDAVARPRPAAVPGRDRRLDARHRGRARAVPVLPGLPRDRLAARARAGCGGRGQDARRALARAHAAARARAGTRCRSAPARGAPRARCRRAPARVRVAADARAVSGAPGAGARAGPRRASCRAGCRSTARATAFALLLAVQLAYTGSLLSVAVLVAGIGAWELARRDTRSAGRLAARLGGSRRARGRGAVRALPARPVARRAAARGRSLRGRGRLCVVSSALVRLAIFFDHVHPVLALLGAVLLGAATPARRVLRATLAAGLALLALRYLLPALFRDAKEVELLAAPVAVAMAAAWTWLWGRGRAGRLAVLASAAWVAALGRRRGRSRCTPSASWRSTAGREDYSAGRQSVTRSRFGSSASGRTRTRRNGVAPSASGGSTSTRCRRST